jgi:hypothetical protein
LAEGDEVIVRDSKPLLIRDAIKTSSYEKVIRNPVGVLPTSETQGGRKAMVTRIPSV